MIFEINTRIARMIRRTGRDDGFSMLPAMTAVFVGSLISMGAWTAANSDVKLQQVDRYGKRAFTAAQTGLADYVQHLASDSSYWSYCDVPPASADPGAVNDSDIGAVGHTTRRWEPGSADETLNYQYSIDLIPTNGYNKCKAESNRALTMINQSTGSFRVRVTGRAGQPVPNTATIAPDPAAPNTFVARTAASVEQWRQRRWKKRSIVVDFRRRGFLDFAYFTDKESQDPALHGVSPTWAAANCNLYYRDGRPSKSTVIGGNTVYCTEIRFASFDDIRGPFHTNDSIYADSGATFGKVGMNDRIEVSDPTNCWIRNQARSGCGNQAGVNFVGTVARGAAAPELQLPMANEDLLTYSADEYNGKRYYGATKILLKTGGKMDVTNNGTTTTDVNFPGSGVIYVSAKVGCVEYDVQRNYHFPAACGSVEVQGTYDRPLTIAAENDIIITEDLEALDSAADAVLGLIANSYVRVRHYVNNDQNANIPFDSCTNRYSGQPRVNKIEAAVLALQHSFVVDNYACGSSLGTLTVNGALTQNYRGTVGRGSGSSANGYSKDYNYDYRLRYLTPPYFLTPSLSGWRISRYREQVPACACNDG